MKLAFGLLLLLGLSQAQEPAPALRGSAIDAVSAPSSLDLSEESPYLLERQGRRQLEVGGMKPLSCNDSFSSCVDWSDFVGRNDRHTDAVTIPCGRCVIMDHDGGDLHLDGGLDIQGKLIFPDRYSGLTLYSTMIVVQGVLEMASTSQVGETPAVKFVMTGNTDRYFEPVGENERYCGGRTCLAGKKAITVAGGHVDIRGLPRGTKTWVNLYDVTGTGQSTNGLVVPEDGVLGKWGEGAEILITSHTISGRDQQVGRISSIDTNYMRDGYVRLFLEESITRPTTTRDDREFAVEVALLSRNIVFQGGRDNVEHHGGHFWIFETSGSNQYIEGVEIVNFGQAGELGRYPLHAHMCGDLAGSVFARNTIKHSNQRCVVVHASDNLLIEENVAYDTAGHCFMLEDGMETGNQFIRNLGAYTRRPGRVIPNMGTNGAETDRDASTFWIPALGNTWVGNVAAGSIEFGWWFEPMLRGPLADNYPDWRPERVNIELFEGNVAHSNGIGMKTYPRKGLRPVASQPNRFVDFKAYRNQFKGLFAFFAHNLVIEGGVFADNAVNLDIDNCLNVHVYDVMIVGESDIHAKQIADQDLRVGCLNNMVVGLQLNTDAGRTGTTVHSASFMGFAGSRCANEYAARLDNNVMRTAGIPAIGEGDSPDEGDRGDGTGGGGGEHALGDLTDGLYINCGSDTAGLGGSITWTPDRYFENGRAIRTNPDDPSNYNQYREQNGASLDYKFPVNDGQYKVTLYWAEYEFRSNNDREFDVRINGNRVLRDFDVYREAGGRRKLVSKTFIANVENDEELHISMKGTTDKAFVSLMSVQTHRVD